jgi:DNA invertase Pin-like site-specific DNA recombinase
MKAIGYARVSSEEQAREGVSIDAQRSRIAAYAQLRGLDLDEIYVDVAVSAGKPLARRPQGRHIVSRAREVDAVVACKLDRLFRDAVDCLSLVRDWDKTYTSLHLIDLGGQSIDTASAMGRFFLTVMAGAAEMERNLIRERTRDIMAHKKANGERVGHVPFGWRVAHDGQHRRKCDEPECPGCLYLEEDLKEQETLRIMVGFRAEDVSIRAIALHMNGIERLNRGRNWTKSAVDRMLKQNRNGACPPRD